MDRQVKKVNWKNPLEETKEFETETFLNNPTYVLNIIYIINGNNIGIYLSKRTQKNKDMYNMWQSPGGKVEKEEPSAQAALKETFEEIGVTITNIQKVAYLKFYFPDKPEWNTEGNVFLVDSWEGEISESEEMLPRWFSLSNLPLKNMWHCDRFWVPEVLDKNLISGSFDLDTEGLTLKQNIKKVRSYH